MQLYVDMHQSEDSYDFWRGEGFTNVTIEPEQYSADVRLLQSGFDCFSIIRGSTCFMNNEKNQNCAFFHHH